MTTALRLSLRRSTGPGRCAVCHDALDPRAAACAACDTWVHAECRAFVGRCPTLGCLAPPSGRATSRRSWARDHPLRFVRRAERRDSSRRARRMARCSTLVLVSGFGAVVGSVVGLFVGAALGFPALDVPCLAARVVAGAGFGAWCWHERRARRLDLRGRPRGQLLAVGVVGLGLAFAVGCATSDAVRDALLFRVF